MVQDEESGRALLIPLLRSLGNVAAGGGAAAVEQLLGPEAAPALQALVTCSQASVGRCRPETLAALPSTSGEERAQAWQASQRAVLGRRRAHTVISHAPPSTLAQSHHHGLQREACWVLSNIAGLPGRGGVDALKAAGAVPVSRLFCCLGCLSG
jgi:hypothetical protein